MPVIELEITEEDRQIIDNLKAMTGYKTDEEVIIAAMERHMEEDKKRKKKEQS